MSQSRKYPNKLSAKPAQTDAIRARPRVRKFTNDWQRKLSLVNDPYLRGGAACDARTPRTENPYVGKPGQSELVELWYMGWDETAVERLWVQNAKTKSP